MTHYYVKSCYIKNRAAFIIAVLGCINREVNKIERGEREKRQKFGEALDALARYLMAALRIEQYPEYVLNMYDCLEATQIGSYYSKVQESADEVVKLLEDDITVHFTGPYGDIWSDFEAWLPDFKGKIKIKYEG